MNRLQKKCLIAVTGTHLLLVVLLLCSGFIRPTPKPDETQVLDVIPAKAIDALFTSGVRHAQPPPPAPMVKPPEPQPQPPVVKQVEPVRPPEKTQPEDLTPVQREESKPVKHVVKPDLTKVTRTPQKATDNSAAEAEKAEKEAQRVRDQRARLYASVIRNLKNNLTSATEIEMPGDSSEAYANYGAIVVSVYHHFWIPPDRMAGESAVVSFSVTIARDGGVIASHITSPSGDASVDNAVQRMLDRVTFIHEFPDDTKDRERTYHIDFNATRTSIQ